MTKNVLLRIKIIKKRKTYTYLYMYYDRRYIKDHLPYNNNHVASRHKSN